MSSIHHAVKLVWVSLAINAVLAVIKILTGFHGHAQALIADGVESAADVVSSLIVLWGINLASRPPDRDHPYGHGKYDSLASIAVAGMLLGAAIWIAVDSIHQLVTPHPLPSPFTIVVLVGVIVLKVVLHRYLSGAGRQIESHSLHGEAIHQHADALTSAAALIGIAIAVLGGPAYANADSWAALVACVVIIYNAIRLIRPAVDEILDASVSDETVRAVRTVASETNGVDGVGKCRVRKSGFGLLVDIHVKVPGELSVRCGHDLAHAVEDRLRQSELGIQDVIVHIEPAVRTSHPVP
ncbi:MAG TPA: cation diffusion facilitator family transporter [Candidatus Limnocylindria bacterium]|nr:cation diffusion facilitator family transporter [Candidatus Limnocylindria bacterium]